MSLNDNEKIKLEIEAGRGEDYERVFETYLAPFFENKQKELFEAFKQLPTSDTTSLTTVKLQCNALQSLADEFQTIIQTGKLARKTLNEEEDNG